MAQISKGIRLMWGAVGSDGRASVRTLIPDVKSVPALGSTPNTLQTTDLMDDKHTYIKGLQDIGGALEFTCNYTIDVINAIDDAVLAQDSGEVEWCVEFPAPLNKRVYWIGEVEPVFNTDVAVDAVVEGTIAIVPNTILQMEDIEEGDYIENETDLRSAITAGKDVVIDGEITLTSPLQLTKAGQRISGIGNSSVIKIELSDTSDGAHAIELSGGVVIENIKFEAVDNNAKPIIIYNEAENTGTPTIKNCTFVGYISDDASEYTLSMGIWTATPMNIEGCTFMDCYTPITVEADDGVVIRDCFWNSGCQFNHPSTQLTVEGNTGLDDTFHGKIALVTLYVEEAVCKSIIDTWRPKNSNMVYTIDGVTYEE